MKKAVFGAGESTAVILEGSLFTGCDDHILDDTLVSKRQVYITYSESSTFHASLCLSWMNPLF